ncbi:MAG: DUF4124 domain-containing protein [Gammaproteobacteria bacterium]|nr:DUF4124 domain-containing protein [Gammaproteobacteria bacterium]
MRLIQFSALVFLVTSITTHYAFADTLVYQCKMKNGHINFTDQPCKKDEKEVKHEMIKNLALVHSVIPKPIKDDPTVKKIEPKNPQKIYLIEEKRVVRRYRNWDSDYPIGILPYPPATWPNAYSPKPPLFNPPLSFNPPLTVQPTSR